MTLIDRYLRAVAAQLPRDARDDIVAELRDAIQTRMEEREDTLNRPLTEAEQEAVLREFGHPLAVAARYGAGPQHLVGPELYPWWLFGVKVALGVMVCVTLIGLAARVLTGDVLAGQAIGQAFADLFSGGVSIVGLATIAAFIMERQKIRPAFIDQWRVKDLGLFEIGGLDIEALGRSGADPAPPRPAHRSGQLSPTARALGSAVAWVVILAWWTGLLTTRGLSPSDIGQAGDGVDWGRIVADTIALLYWPVVIYGVTRILFDLSRAGRPQAIRLIAFGDLILGLARLALTGWLWLYSPVAPHVWVSSPEDWIERVRGLFHGDWSVSAVVLLCLTIAAVAGSVEVLKAAWRLVSGEPRSVDRPWLASTAA